MALKPCRECGAQVSTEAVSCPHCGIGEPASAKIALPLRVPEPIYGRAVR